LESWDRHISNIQHNGSPSMVFIEKCKVKKQKQKAKPKEKHQEIYILCWTKTNIQCVHWVNKEGTDQTCVLEKVVQES